MPATVNEYDVAIIGAGFCGTMVAVNLAQSGQTLRVALIEKNERHGPGLAYGTPDADHLLNVRAARMGAFPDRTLHFWEWISRRPGANSYTRDDFVPRQLYGTYLQEQLAEARKAQPNLHLLHRHVVDMRRNGAGFELIDADGGNLTAGKVVLALGNFPPDPNAADTANPYAPRTWDTLARDGDVLIVGTGLTSLDLVVTLAKAKRQGIIHLLSRHGLLPREHAHGPEHQLSFLPGPVPGSVLGLCRAIRAEVAAAARDGMPWQSVLDALRPYNQLLWQGLDADQKRQFLRHLRAYWDVHRHRCATQIMDVYRGLEAQGRIQLHHGRILSQCAVPDGWQVAWQPRGTSSTETLCVQSLVRCTGPQADFRKLPDALVRALLGNGLICPDPLRMGIATAEDHTVLGADGTPTEGLFALGTVLKGRLYESVAVPELRGQAADVARSVLN
jgi:uncharacterized NAD(P)/FAD-binding protein YdhS